MNQEIKKRWVDALRSGKYIQGCSYLRRGDEFCCLGVISDIYATEHNVKWEPIYDCPAYELLSSVKVLPSEVAAWAGLHLNPEIGAYTLASLNDSGASFLEIADLIEREL